jgi:hypothetical protein
MNTTMNMTVEEVLENIMRKKVNPNLTSFLKRIEEEEGIFERVNYVIAMYDFIFEMLPFICFVKDSKRHSKYNKLYNEFLIKIPQLIMELHTKDICPLKKMECVQSLIRVQLFDNTIYRQENYDRIKHSHSLLEYYFAVQISIMDKESLNLVPSSRCQDPSSNDSSHIISSKPSRKRIARFPELLGQNAVNCYK